MGKDVYDLWCEIIFKSLKEISHGLLKFIAI